MDALSQWGWVIKGTQGAVSLLEMLAREGGPISDHWYEELRGCANDLQALVSLLAARPEIAQSPHRAGYKPLPSSPESGSSERSEPGSTEPSASEER